MITRTLTDAVDEAVRAVPDPELAGVGIGDLGLVHEVRVDDTAGAVDIELIPTFLGCPALGIIERDVRAAVAGMPGTGAISVRFVTTPAWSPARISERGRTQLAQLGIAVDTGRTRFVSVTCPVCGAARLRPVSEVGPTACRSVAWCDSCRNPVEVVRQ
jgi:ring-1,2-phenylacetyl-CoA epoxidase subunit PaaD